MKLIHNSAQPLTAVHSVKQSRDSMAHFQGKPHGLWVSDGDAWMQCCRENDFGNATHQTEIVLERDANIRIIASVQDIDTFTGEYGISFDPNMTREWRVIDWAKVATIYQGIVISPYQWGRQFQMDTFWYYSWDCASGCIWDASAIAGLHTLTEQNGVEP